MGGIRLGIDIGHHAVKVAGLTAGAKPRLIGCKSIPVDPLLLGRDKLDDTAPIADALKQALAEAAPKKLTGGQATLALSEAFLSRKVLDLPPLASDEELRAAVTVQAAEYLPLPIDEMELDFQVLGTQADGSMRQVMVVAASSKLIEFYVKATRAAGIDLMAIDAKPSSLGRLLVPPKTNDAFVLLDVGTEISTVSVYHRGLVQVASTVNLGGGIVNDPATGKPDVDRQDALVARLLGEISEEVEHVIKFYTNRSLDEEPVKGILLTGGGSLATGDIPEQLGKLLPLPLSIAKPPMTLPPFCDRRFNGALGAALYPLHG